MCALSQRSDQPTLPGVPLPPDVVDRLLRACDGERPRDLRDMALVRLWSDTGLRRRQLARLRLADIDIRGRSATVHGRDGSARTVPFTASTATAMGLYLGTGRPRQGNPASPALWLGRRGPMTARTIDRALRSRAERAGLGPVRPSELREALVRAWVTAEIATVADRMEGTITATLARLQDRLEQHAAIVEQDLERLRARLAELEAGTPVVVLGPADAMSLPTRGVPVMDAADRSAPDRSPPDRSAPDRSPRGPVTSRVVLTGLRDLLSVARFQRELGRPQGITEVGVQTGGNGTYRYTVTHDPAVSLVELIPQLPGFHARVLESGDGIVTVSATDPER